MRDREYIAVNYHRWTHGVADTVEQALLDAGCYKTPSPRNSYCRQDYDCDVFSIVKGTSYFDSQRATGGDCVTIGYHEVKGALESMQRMVDRAGKDLAYICRQLLVQGIEVRLRGYQWEDYQVVLDAEGMEEMGDTLKQNLINVLNIECNGRVVYHQGTIVVAVQ